LYLLLHAFGQPHQLAQPMIDSALAEWRICHFAQLLQAEVGVILTQLSDLAQTRRQLGQPLSHLNEANMASSCRTEASTVLFRLAVSAFTSRFT